LFKVLGCAQDATKEIFWQKDFKKFKKVSIQNHFKIYQVPGTSG
jgi:hypothetical protein